MAKPGLTLHRLKLFLAVLDHGGVTRAAEKENICQPTISEHLRGLEEYYGISLLERTGRGVRPTAAARQLEPFARQVVQLLQSSEQLAFDIRGIRAGKLTIGASSTPGTYLLPQALGQFQALYPGIELQLRIHNTAQVEQWVANGEVELGIVGDTSELDNNLAGDPWVEDELVVLLNRRHRLAQSGTVTAEALHNEPCIAREAGSGTRRAAEHLLRLVGARLRPTMELGSTEAIREAVAAGLGLAVVSTYAMPVADPRVVPVRLGGAVWHQSFSVIRQSKTALAPAAARFRDMLLKDPSRTARSTQSAPTTEYVA